MLFGLCIFIIFSSSNIFTNGRTLFHSKDMKDESSENRKLYHQTMKITRELRSPILHKTLIDPIKRYPDPYWASNSLDNAPNLWLNNPYKEHQVVEESRIRDKPSYLTSIPFLQYYRTDESPYTSLQDQFFDSTDQSNYYDPLLSQNQFRGLGENEFLNYDGKICKRNVVRLLLKYYYLITCENNENNLIEYEEEDNKNTTPKSQKVDAVTYYTQELPNK